MELPSPSPHSQGDHVASPWPLACGANGEYFGKTWAFPKDKFFSSLISLFNFVLTLFIVSHALSDHGFRVKQQDDGTGNAQPIP